MSDRSKIFIELDPYNAIEILAFCRAFINDDLPNKYKYQVIKEAVDEFESELGTKISPEQFEEIMIQEKVNKLIGKGV